MNAERRQAVVRIVRRIVVGSFSGGATAGLLALQSFRGSIIDLTPIILVGAAIGAIVWVAFGEFYRVSAAATTGVAFALTVSICCGLLGMAFFQGGLFPEAVVSALFGLLFGAAFWIGIHYLNSIVARRKRR